MKKSLQLFFAAIITTIILAACGQGEGAIEPEENGSGIDSDHNEELIDDSEQPEKVTEPATDDDENQEVVSEDTIHPVELFFSDHEVMEMYKVETTIEAEKEDVLIKTLEAWVAGPNNDHLISLIPTNVKVQSVEEENGIAHVSFSKEILDANVGSGAEEMLLQQVALTMKQFGFNKTLILVEGEVQDMLFGHIETNVPIEAMDVNKIESFDE